MQYTTLMTPVGCLTIAGDDAAVRRVCFAEVPFSPAPVEPEPGWTETTSGVVMDCAQQLREYFQGQRKQFDIPLDAEGTAFQRSVWRALEGIPYGETISYAELAQRVGKPKAARAVGSANGANQTAIVVPCHRVIAADGGIGGFGGSIAVKRVLLDLEAKHR